MQHEVEIYESLEQGTDEWKQLRAGVITASRASRLVTSKGEKSKAGFEDLDEQGNPTGIINVVLTPSNTGSGAAKPRGPQQSFAPNNRFAKGQGSGYNKTNYRY